MSPAQHSSPGVSAGPGHSWEQLRKNQPQISKPGIFPFFPTSQPTGKSSSSFQLLPLLSDQENGKKKGFGGQFLCSGLGWEGLKQQQHQREPPERGVRSRGCADSLECQEFPIIIPLPWQGEHQNRTLSLGMGKSHRAKGGNLGSGHSEQLGGLSCARADSPHPKIITPSKGRAHLLSTHILPKKSSKFPAFPPKNWSSNSAVPPQINQFIFSQIFALSPR